MVAVFEFLHTGLADTQETCTTLWLHSSVPSLCFVQSFLRQLNSFVQVLVSSILGALTSLMELVGETKACGVFRFMEFFFVYFVFPFALHRTLRADLRVCATLARRVEGYRALHRIDPNDLTILDKIAGGGFGSQRNLMVFTLL